MSKPYFKHLIIPSILTLLLSGCNTTTNTDTVKRNRPAAGYNVQLGVGYLQQGDVKRAKSKLLLALEQAPDWPPAVDAMAYFQETTGNPGEAKQYYDRSLAIAPNDGNVLNNYAAYLCRSGQPQQAEAYFMQAVKDPAYLTVAEAYENAGLCALTIPDKAKASMYFHKSLAHDSRRGSSILELGKLANKPAEYQQIIQAVNTYTRIVTPPSPDVLQLGIRMANRVGDVEAEKRFNKLLEISKIS